MLLYYIYIHLGEKEFVTPTMLDTEAKWVMSQNHIDGEGVRYLRWCEHLWQWTISLRGTVVPLDTRVIGHAHSVKKLRSRTLTSRSVGRAYLQLAAVSKI